MKIFLTIIAISFVGSVSMANPRLDHCDSDDAVCVGKVILKALKNGGGGGTHGTPDVLGASCQDRDNDGKWVIYQLAKSGNSLTERKVYSDTRGLPKDQCEAMVREVPKSCGREDRKVQFFGCQDSDLNGEWVLRSFVATHDGRTWQSQNTTDRLSKQECYTKLANFPKCVF